MAKQVLFEIKIDSDFEQLNKLERELQSLRDERKKLQDIRKKEGKLNQEEQRQLTAIGTKMKQVTKARNEQQKSVLSNNAANKRLISQYDRESQLLNKLRKRLKDAILTEGQAAKSTQQLAKRVQTLDKRLKSVDASAGQFQRNVGNYKSGMQGFGGSMVKAGVAAAGMLGGAQALISVVGGAVDTVKEFQQSNANLAAVLGKTRGDIKALTEDAKRLGAQTSFSATQVSELQTEFAKLGFSEQQILNATEATLDLAAASGTDLANAAAIAGATLGGFGMGAEDTQKVVDVMAKSFSTSALDITKFQESMKVAAPAAAALGLGVEETTAMLGTLANAGISGSNAGTALRATFINLNKAGISLDDALAQVANSQDKLGTATKLVGKNASTAFLALAEGTDTTAKLTEELNKADGAAREMAKTQLDTLDGAIKILQSSWEGLILSLEDGGGEMSNVAKIVIQDLSTGLSVLSGNLDATNGKLSFFAMWFSTIKTAINVQIGILKALTAPWRALFELFTRIGQKLGILDEGFGGLEATLLKVQNAIIHLPDIIDLAFDHFEKQVDRVVDIFENMFDFLVGLFTLNLPRMKEAGGKIADAIIEGFKANLRFGDEVADELEGSRGRGAERAARETGKKVGKSFGESAGKTGAKSMAENLEKEWKARSTKYIKPISEDIVENLKKELNREFKKEGEGLWEGMKFSDPGEMLDDRFLSDEERDLLKQKAIDLAQETSDAIFEIQLANNERRKQYQIDQLAIETAAEQDNLKARLESGLISQQEYENNRIALEQQTQDARREIEKEAFIRQKRLQTAQAIANGALAITRILADTPKVDFGVATAIQIAAATAATAVQVGTIQAQKFAKGGVLQGASHAEGGIPTAYGELEGGEAVINKKSTEKYLPLLSAINMAEGGRAFGNFGSPAPVFARGGVLGDAGSAMDSQQLAQDIASSIRQIPVVNVATDTANVVNKVANIESDVSL